MRIYAIFLLWVLIHWGCANNKVELIPESQMVTIMTDLMLADYTMRQFPVPMRDSIKIELVKNLLKVHKLTQVELDTNLYLYSVDFEKYQELLESIEVRLDSLKEAQGQQKPQQITLPTKIN